MRKISQIGETTLLIVLPIRFTGKQLIIIETLVNL